jgi:ribosomal protein S18 acetylase RimI-like enzyme
VTEVNVPLDDPLDVRLRTGRPDDAVRLAAVFVSAWRRSYPGVVPEKSLRRLDAKEIATWLQTLLGSSASTTTVPESDDHELLGFCRYGEDPNDGRNGHVFSRYVSPSASNRGIGRRLLAHALENLERRRLDPVTLWVFERNELAGRLYDSFGFSPDGARRVAPEYGAEEIRLRVVAKSVP